MAIRAIPSIRLARTIRTNEASSDPPIPGKWHPRMTLLFILTSCGLLWAAIFAAIFYLR